MKCSHRWIVEPPNGTAELTGYCRECKVVRTWPAVPEYAFNGALKVALARKRGAERGLVKANRRRHGA